MFNNWKFHNLKHFFSYLLTSNLQLDFLVKIIEQVTVHKGEYCDDEQ